LCKDTKIISLQIFFPFFSPIPKKDVSLQFKTQFMEAAVLERKVKQLPFGVRRDLSDYLDFLLHKYRIEKKEITFTDFGLVMPADYKFDREEANAR